MRRWSLESSHESQQNEAKNKYTIWYFHIKNILCFKLFLPFKGDV